MVISSEHEAGLGALDTKRGGDMVPPTGWQGLWLLPFPCHQHCCVGLEVLICLICNHTFFPAVRVLIAPASEWLQERCLDAKWVLRLSCTWESPEDPERALTSGPALEIPIGLVWCRTRCGGFKPPLGDCRELPHRESLVHSFSA